MRALNLFDQNSSEKTWAAVFGETTVQDFLRSSLESSREWQSLLIQVASRYAELNGLDSENERRVNEILERHIVEVVLQGPATQS